MDNVISIGRESTSGLIPSGGGLISVTYDQERDQQMVSARELHNFLEVDTPYHKWFPRMCEYGFTEGTDFAVTDIFVHNSKGGRQSMKDAAITIDMAKELCMIQRTEKGKIARRYFVELEKAWNTPEIVMARALKLSERKIIALEAKIAADAPKVAFADDVGECPRDITVEKFAKATYERFNLGRNQMHKALRDLGFLMANRLPYQKWINAGLFHTFEELRNGHPVMVTTITGKGQRKLYDALCAAIPNAV